MDTERRYEGGRYGHYGKCLNLRFVSLSLSSLRSPKSWLCNSRAVAKWRVLRFCLIQIPENEKMAADMKLVKSHPKFWYTLCVQFALSSIPMPAICDLSAFGDRESARGSCKIWRLANCETAPAKGSAEEGEE